MSSQPTDDLPGPAMPASAVTQVPSRYGWSMLRRFGWFYTILGFGHFLGKLRFEDHSVEQIREAASRGTVVYVLRRSSTANHLALNTVLNRRRLPLSVWANGATSFFWQPVVAAWRDLAQRVRTRLSQGPAPDPIASGWLSKLLADGAPITVFLDEAPHGESHALSAVLDAQSNSQRPIQLVPVVVVWDRAPHTDGVVRAFLQAAPSPGLLTGLRNIWFRSAEAFVQVGTPLDLPTFVTRIGDHPRRTDALHALLRRYLYRESRVVRGPRLLSRHAMKLAVLDNPPMRQLARDEAQALGRSYAQVRKQMDRDFDAVAANFRWWVIRAADVVLRPLWTRIFSGVDVRPEDIERIRTAMRDGTAVLVPSHKSHFDYLLLSWVLYQHSLIVPHVVAGMNLAIWPVSVVLRSAGGFFIKRSFSGERIFPAVFSRYLRELILQGYPVEFFIEGGRTRSGKLLPPRIGVLGMVLDAAALRPTNHEVTLLPIALSYEQVAEEGSYARELGGAAKEPESVGQLVQARSVLRRRYGRVYLRVGEPIACGPTVDTPAWEERDPSDKKHTLRRIAERLLYRIAHATMLLPTSLVALALLAHHRRGIEHRELLARIQRFHRFLQHIGVQQATSLTRPDQAITHALERFERAGRIRALAHAGSRIWEIIPDQRITLDFYKNQVLHFFVESCLCAAAIRGGGDEVFSADSLRARFRSLIWTLRREFPFDPDRSTGILLQSGLNSLEAYGAISATPGGYRVVDTGRIGEVYALLRPLLESYLLTLRAGVDHLPHELSTRDYAKRLQDASAPLLDAGVLSRPEALSLVTLKNAIDAYLDDGVLQRTDGRISEDPALRDAAINTLSPMVD